MNSTMTTTKLCPYCAEEIQEAAVKCKHCGSWLDGHPDSYGHAAPGTGKFAGAFGMKRRLTRSSSDEKVAGVCAGIARMLGVDPTLVRIVFALATVFTAVVPGVIVYCVLGMVIPRDDTVID